jgi:hypothetical protein
MLARRFLWFVTWVIILLLVGAVAYKMFERQLVKLAMVPTVKFEEAATPMPPGPTYADASLWIGRPDIRQNNPSFWAPEGYTPAPAPKAAVFFIHPTSFLERDRWNAPVDHEESQNRARLFVRSQASAFNSVGEVWAPKYRQATFGAFLTTKEDAQKALDFAYRDVLGAFDAFIEQVAPDRPIILAGHSQGSLHLMRLLRERIAGKKLAERIVAAYVVGWPISTTADLPDLGLPACSAREQAGCVLSWQSFGEPADPAQVTDVYDPSTAPNGVARRGSPMLCTNPLTGGTGGTSETKANLGTLIPNADLTQAKIEAGAVGARCDMRGFLLIGEDPPEMGPYVLPGNNYHVYDYALFWANVRADAEARLASYVEQ